MSCYSPERKYMQPMRGRFQIKQACFKTGWHGLLKKFRKASEKERRWCGGCKQAAVFNASYPTVHTAMGTFQHATA
jgi:hypothetical protein